MKRIHDGLAILLKYGDGHIAAEHDEIFAGSKKAHPDKMDNKDIEALRKLGWSWQEDSDSWHHFV